MLNLLVRLSILGLCISEVGQDKERKCCLKGQGESGQLDSLFAPVMDAAGEGRT